MVAVVTVSLRELLAEASLASRRAGHIIGRVCMDAKRKWSQIGMLVWDPELGGLPAILHYADMTSGAICSRQVCCAAR
jgi:hypothetical protein